MPAKLWVGLVISAMLVGCGNGKPAKEPRHGSAGSSSWEGTDEPIADSDELEFDEEMAQTMLKRSERKAQQCVATNNAPVGEYEIEVVWDGAKGKIIEVDLGYSFESSSDLAKDCLKKAFIGEIIPPFSGKKTQKFTLTLNTPKAAPKAPPKAKEK